MTFQRGLISKQGAVIYIKYLRLQMFSKLIDNPDLPHKEQQQVLKTVLTQNLKQNVHEVRLQFNHNYPQLRPILLKHPKKSLRLALSLHTWQLSLQNISNKTDNPAVDLLLSVIRENPCANGEYLLTDLFKSFSDCWRMIVILKIVSEEVVQHLPTNTYGWFLAYFVMISASTIQNYLKLKQEPAQSNSDRAENDLKLIDNTEQWITNAYLKVIAGLKEPTKQQDRKIVLAAFSQICGALMENQGGGLLIVDKLLQIQRSALEYLSQTYSLREIRDMFLRQLRDENYTLRLQKIEIPSKYTSTFNYAKEGICWLIQQLLRQNGDIYSQEEQLNLLLLAFSESLQSHLPLKEDFLTEIKNKFNRKVSILDFEHSYPLSILLFNVYLYKREELDYFTEQLGLNKDYATDLRRWKKLLSTNFDKLNIDRVALVVSQVTPKHIQERQILSLIKSLKFDFTGKELCESVSKLIASAITAHPEAKKVVSWLVTRERQNQRNVDFCDELAKTHAL